MPKSQREDRGTAGRGRPIYAPWRIRYIRSVRKPKVRCIFCAAAKSRDDRKSLVLDRGRTCFLVLNLYPYTGGHLMVAPYRHRDSLADMADGEILELMAQARRAEIALRRLMNPDGFNLGINLGRVAGQGVLGHLHLHVVPRWNGDANFMPVIGGTHTVPHALDDLYLRLRRELRKTR